MCPLSFLSDSTKSQIFLKFESNTQEIRGLCGHRDTISFGNEFQGGLYVRIRRYIYTPFSGTHAMSVPKV